MMKVYDVPNNEDSASQNLHMSLHLPTTEPGIPLLLLLLLLLRMDDGAHAHRCHMIAHRTFH